MTGFVFFPSRSFADDHDLSINIAVARHGDMARSMKRALQTTAYHLRHFINSLRSFNFVHKDQG